MSQSVGYLVTAAGTWAVGAVADAVDGWTLSLGGLVVIVLVMVACGLRAGRPTALVGGGAPAGTPGGAVPGALEPLP